MKLVVGLGNPGKKYEQTRHNVGFKVLRELAGQYCGGAAKSRFDGQVVEAAIEGQAVLLLAPHTYMNASGRSVRAAVDFYKLPHVDLLVIGDDFHLPLGKLRMRARGSAGGQKGLADILRHLQTEEISRLRIGVGPVPEHRDPADFVLSRFSAQQRATVDDMIGQAAQAVRHWVAAGVDEAMNRFN